VKLSLSTPWLHTSTTPQWVTISPPLLESEMGLQGYMDAAAMLLNLPAFLVALLLRTLFWACGVPLGRWWHCKEELDTCSWPDAGLPTFLSRGCERAWRRLCPRENTRVVPCCGLTLRMLPCVVPAGLGFRGEVDAQTPCVTSLHWPLTPLSHPCIYGVLVLPKEDQRLGFGAGLVCDSDKETEGFVSSASGTADDDERLLRMLVRHELAV
jgi:hypothetical protein